MIKWWKNYNNKLVDLMFQRLRAYPSTTISHFLKTEFNNYDFPQLLKVYAGLELVFFAVYGYAREFNNLSISSYVAESIILLGFSFLILAYTLRQRTGELLLQLQFRWLPGFKHRSSKLLSLHRQSLRPVLVSEDSPSVQLFSENLPLKELEKELVDNPKAFCQKYFNKSGSGFVSFYCERAFVRYKNNMVDPVFVNYSLIIPKSRELSVDQFRKILTAFSPLETGVSLTYPDSKNRFNYLNLAPFQDFFNQLFQDYSCTQIERIFTNYQNRTFVSRLVNYPEKYLTVLPVARNFGELEDFLREKKIPSHPVNSLDGKIIEGLTFKVLKNQAEYQRMGNVFYNCLEKYFEREEEIVVVVFKDKNPEACLSVDHDSLIDIKGISNKESKYKTLIFKILRAHQIIC